MGGDGETYEEFLHTGEKEWRGPTLRTCPQDPLGASGLGMVKDWEGGEKREQPPALLVVL